MINSGYENSFEVDQNYNSKVDQNRFFYDVVTLFLKQNKYPYINGSFSKINPIGFDKNGSKVDGSMFWLIL